MVDPWLAHARALRTLSWEGKNQHGYDVSIRRLTPDGKARGVEIPSVARGYPKSGITAGQLLRDPQQIVPLVAPFPILAERYVPLVPEIRVSPGTTGGVPGGRSVTCFCDGPPLPPPAARSACRVTDASGTASGPLVPHPVWFPNRNQSATSVPQGCTLSRPCCRQADDPACGRSWRGRPHPGFVSNLKRRDST